MDTKTCRGCRAIKTLDDFHLMSSSPDGRQSQCKACRKAYAAQRFVKDRDRIVAVNRDWKQRNPDKVARVTRRRLLARSAPCKEPGCEAPKRQGAHRCRWHWLKVQPILVQVNAADARRAGAGEARARVPAAEWPEGYRWCAGCQTFVPKWYTTGSRCKACASVAAHKHRLRSVYGISDEDYRDLLKLQDGRCFICRRITKKRLAVDHDHETGQVRGLLCADNERGCNHAILGNIRDIAMAQRIVEYLQNPPMARLAAARATLPPSGPVGSDWTKDPSWNF